MSTDIEVESESYLARFTKCDNDRFIAIHINPSAFNITLLYLAKTGINNFYLDFIDNNDVFDKRKTITISFLKDDVGDAIKNSFSLTKIQRDEIKDKCFRESRIEREEDKLYSESQVSGKEDGSKNEG